MAFWKRKEVSLIDEKMRLDKERAKLRAMRAENEELKDKASEAKEKQKLRQEIADSKSEIRREKYRHAHTLAKKVQGSGSKLGKKGGGFGSRISRNMNSPAFSNFLSTGGKKKPARKKLRKRKVVYYG